MDLWDCIDEKIWRQAEDNYWKLIRPENVKLEQEMEVLSAESVKNMTPEEFYSFLYNRYFVWKYTAKNRLATTRMWLRYYENHLNELEIIHQKLFTFNQSDIAAGLRIATSIKGLGYAGASGLLAVLFPDYFGTVDQFVAARLKEFSAFSEDDTIQRINEQSIKEKEAVYMEKLFRKKAAELNLLNQVTYWTPRKIDKVLWGYQR